MADLLESELSPSAAAEAGLAYDESTHSSKSLTTCESCKKSHLKCSGGQPGGQPCKHCVANKLECVFRVSKKRGPKPGQVRTALQRICAWPRAYSCFSQLKELQAQLESLTKLVREQEKCLESLSAPGARALPLTAEAKRRAVAVIPGGAPNRALDVSASLPNYISVFNNMIIAASPFYNGPAVLSRCIAA
jgi:hypothetical protein